MLDGRKLAFSFRALQVPYEAIDQITDYLTFVLNEGALVVGDKADIQGSVAETLHFGNRTAGNDQKLDESLLLPILLSF
jgi:hypothetical protein